MKTTILTALLAASLAMAIGVPAAAQTAPIEDQIVNTPGLGGISISGLEHPPRTRRDAAVQGGQALRVAVPGAQTDAWKVSLGNKLVKPVRKGNVLVVAFWARTEAGPDGSDSINLPYNGLQLAQEPYSPLFHAPLVIGPAWTLHEVRGVADRDYQAGELMVMMHLATGKQTIDFGPVFVLELDKR